MVDFIGLSVVDIFIAVIGYLYLAIVLQSIAKKTNTPRSWMAWIPFVNLILLADIAQMYWWPVLIIPIVYVIGIIPVENFLLSILSLVLSIVALLYLLTYWEKLFKRVGMSQWWVLALLVPILNLVAIGLAAWGKQEVKEVLQ